MKYLLPKYLLLVSLLLSASALAQQPLSYNKCIRTAMTQTAMNLCSYRKAVLLGRQLNNVYHKLLLEATSEPSATANIVAMERAWVTYRDRYMAAMYPAKDKQAEYGSIYPLEANLLLAQLTKTHITALEVLLKQYGPAVH